MVQRPRNCHFADRMVVAFGYRPQERDQRQVERDIWSREVRMPPAPIVLGQRGRTLTGHSAGQETGSHRGVNDDSTIVPLALAQNLIFHRAMHPPLPPPPT